MKRSLFCIIVLTIFLSACILYEPLADSTPQVPGTIPQETVTISPTESILPTATLMATKTATLEPTVTFTPTMTLTATPVPYHLQSTTPIYLQNFVHSDSGCNWMGIGGQVFDRLGNPMPNLVVWVMGVIDSQPIERIVLTGTTAGDNYGKAGFEAILSAKPLRTEDVFSIQILDINGNVLSERISFDTSDQCDENLIIINFVEE